MRAIAEHGEHHDRRVVVQRRLVQPRDMAQNVRQERGCGRLSRCCEVPEQGLDPEAPFRAPSLDHAVGVEDDTIPGAQGSPRRYELPIGEQSERRKDGTLQLLETAIGGEAAWFRVRRR